MIWKESFFCANTPESTVSKGKMYTSDNAMKIGVNFASTRVISTLLVSWNIHQPFYMGYILCRLQKESMLYLSIYSGVQNRSAGGRIS